MTQKENTIDVPIDPEKYRRWNNSDPRTRNYVQNEFPELSAPLREFLITGTTPKEWEDLFEIQWQRFM
jgi:hypothetical protein